MLKRFTLWAALVLLLLVSLVMQLHEGAPLNTNLLALLPHADTSQVTSVASSQFAKSMGNELVFLVGNTDKEKAVKAADIFYASLKNSPLFKTIDYKIDDAEQVAWGRFYFPYRLSLLTARDKALLQSGKIKTLQTNALADLYSPMGFAGGAMLEHDPYLLFQRYITTLAKPASHLSLMQQRLMTHSDNHWYIMINAHLQGSSFSLKHQNDVLSYINKSKKTVMQQVPNSSLLMTGMLVYAKAGADNAQHDISTIGVGSLFGVILLILFTFRSLSPLFFTVLSSAVGCLAAFVITHFLFGNVTLFTLVFGASLIGISVDYAFFYYADQLLGGPNWNASTGLRNIFVGISLGLLNIVLAYGVLAFTPFPGLQQLAVFAIAGLTLSYMTVVCAFPLILKPIPRASNPLLLRLTNRYLSCWSRLKTKHCLAAFLVLVCFCGMGLLKLTSNDDIRQLEGLPAALKHEEARLKHIIGSTLGKNFFVVTGNTPEETLLHEASLRKALDQEFKSVPNRYLAISSYLPTVKTQKENYNLIKTKLVNNSLVAYLEELGVAKAKSLEIKNALKQISFKPLTLVDWQKSPVSKSLRFLWLGKIKSQYASVILLSDSLDTKRCEKIGKQFSHSDYINKVDQLSAVFKIYREKITELLGGAYFILMLLLILRMGLKKALSISLPPIFSCLISLATLGWLGIPLTLFNVLGLILILGIAVDYVLFFVKTKASYQGTMLAVSLSALTTILSFGLLALSHTPVIHYFGITVTMGIGTAFLLSPFVVRTLQLEAEND